MNIQSQRLTSLQDHLLRAITESVVYHMHEAMQHVFAGNILQSLVAHHQDIHLLEDNAEYCVGLLAGQVSVGHNINKCSAVCHQQHFTRSITVLKMLYISCTY